MLDLEELVPAEENGLSIVSLAAMRKHLRMSANNMALDDQISDAIIEAADEFHGPNGRLNRTIFPTTWKRWLGRFPAYPHRFIWLPYPPLIEVLSVSYEEDGSPSSALDPSLYVVGRQGDMGYVQLVDNRRWPTVTAHPRAVSITFRAGYLEYPPQLKRAVKILAAHALQNPEATLTERSQSQQNRKVEFGLDSIINRLRVSADYVNWE